MDIASVKLTLVERLMLVWDEAALQRIGKAIETEITEKVEEEDDYTDEEIAELDRRREERLQGKVPSHSMEESLRLAREGFKG